jgi:2-methylcitrate dehydratase PrpD
MITEKMARIIVNTDYEKLPEEVIKKAKQCFIDFLAVSLRGSRTPSGTIIKDIFRYGNGSTVIGSKQVSCTDAALVNGVFAHSLDLDDGHRFAHLHPGCSVISSALSVSENRDIRGKDFISAIVAGYQVSILMGIIVNPQHRNNGFHSTGTCGTFGAAAASSRACGLKFKDVLNALGLAGTQAAGLLESDHSGSMGKHLHAGKAAQSGVISTILAENGFSGASSIIDGNEGFLNAMVSKEVISSKISRKDIVIKAEELISNKKYHIMDVYFKKYPVCRHLHSSIDAIIEIHKQMDLDQIKSQDINSIKIKTYKIASEHDDYHPKTFEAVKQSLPVSTAISILNGDLNLHNIEINDEIVDLASKIDIKCDPEMEHLYPMKRASEVTIVTSNDQYSCRVDLPLGEPENPFTEMELLNKFQELNPEVDIDILKILNHLESYKIRDLMDILNNEFKK